MGRKRKAPAADADGILDAGIYRRRVTPRPSDDDIAAAVVGLQSLKGLPKGKPARKRTSSSAAVTEISASRQRKTIREWLAIFRRGLDTSIHPHVAKGLLGDSPESYRPLDKLRPEVRDAVLDAIEAIQRVRMLEMMITPDDKIAEPWTLAHIVQDAYKLGRIHERAGVRQFEPLVRVRRKSLDAINDLNRKRVIEKTKRRIALADEALRAVEDARLLYPDRSEDVLKRKAGESLSISKEAINKRLRNDPRNNLGN